MTRSADASANLIPTSRFDWERVIRRVRLPVSVKGTALFLATYADGDGGRVRPGNERLMRVTGSSDKTIRRHVHMLLDSGLLVKTRHGNRHAGQANEYQLSVPADIVSRLDMMDPGELIALPTLPSEGVYRSSVTGRDVDKAVDDAPPTAVATPGLPVTSSRSTGHWRPSLPVTGDRPPSQYQPQPTQSDSDSKVSTDRARRRAHPTLGVAG